MSELHPLEMDPNIERCMDCGNGLDYCDCPDAEQQREFQARLDELEAKVAATREEAGRLVSASMAEVISGFLEEFGDHYDLSHSPHIKLLADEVTAALAANGYGKLENAWDEGRRVGQAHQYNFFTSSPIPTNPYRRPE